MVGLQLVVGDAGAARAELLQRGIEVGEVQSFPWGEFVFFADPDGNRWSVQQVPTAADPSPARTPGSARNQPDAGELVSRWRARARPAEPCQRPLARAGHCPPR